MPDLTQIYEATEPAPIADALSEAATTLRKAFTTRANKHGVDDAEAIRLMACHKAITKLRQSYENDTV